MTARVTLVLLAVALTAALACGGKESGEGPEPAASVAPSATPEPTATQTPTPMPTPTATPTPTVTPSPTPSARLPSAEDILEASTEAMMAVSSFHFELDVVVKVESDDFALDLPVEISGDYQAPDRIKASLKMVVIFLTIETEMVSLGNTQYIKEPETGEWQVTVGESSIFLDPAQFVQVELENLKDLAIVGLESLDGVEVYHLTATTAEGTYGGGEGEFQLSLWARVEDGLVARVVAEGEIDLGEVAGDLLGDVGQGAAAVTLKVTLSNFDEEVTIEAPISVPTSSPTSTLAPDATPTPAPQQQGASVVADPDALLQRINAAMGEIDSVHIEGEASVKESEDADSTLLSFEFEGDSIPGGDSRMLMTLELDLGGFAGRFSFETRKVDGVSYTQDPFTGQWRTEEGDSSLFGLLSDAGGLGDISLENMTVELEVLDGLEVYHITGSVPDEPELDFGVLWVGVDDLLVRKVRVPGHIPAGELEGLVQTDSGEVFISTTMTFSRYGEPVAVEAPKVD